MDKEVSIVKVDKRPYRVIARENWGLTDSQMLGMHVHHRIPVSEGGTNDASNLFVCSPSFHAYAWHGRDSYHSFVKWAEKGGRLGAAALKSQCAEFKSRGEKFPPAVKRAKAAHSKHHGTEDYSNRQMLKGIKAAAAKRKHWSREEFEFVWKKYLQKRTSGYLIGKELGVANWKRFAHMLSLAEEGLTFEQATDPVLYAEEKLRLSRSPVTHILDRYDD